MECQKSLADFVYTRNRFNQSKEGIKTNIQYYGKQPTILIEIEGNTGYFKKAFDNSCNGCINLIEEELICLPDTLDPRSPKH
jgi:hypothetical protein